MNGATRWLPLAGVALAAALFTAWNRGERVVVDLGLATFYRAPLTVVVAVAFVAGMLAMLLLGLRHDLRVRRELAARRAAPHFSSHPAPASRPAEPARDREEGREPLDIHVLPPADTRPD